MKNIVLAIILLIFCIDLSAQNKSKKAQKDSNKAEIKKENVSKGFAQDSLFVITKGDLRYIKHKVRKGETVYSITRFYNIEIDKLKRNNPEFEKEGLKVSQWLLIPINPKALIVKKGKDFKVEHYLKVFYTVLPKETMYGVAKGHFGISVEELQLRNGLKGTDLSVGQHLQVGWLSKSGIPDSLNRLPWLNASLGEENKRLKKKYEKALLDGAQEIKQDGKAVWPKDKQMGSGSSLYILHSEAKPGSVVRIENPMSERVIYAKVIGKVPDTEFARGSIAMISTTIANVLGVLDSTVFLKIQFLKEKQQ